MQTRTEEQVYETLVLRATGDACREIKPRYNERLASVQMMGTCDEGERVAIMFVSDHGNIEDQGVRTILGVIAWSPEMGSFFKILKSAFIRTNFEPFTSRRGNTQVCWRPR